MRESVFTVGFDGIQPEQRSIAAVCPLDEPCDLEIGSLIVIDDDVDKVMHLAEVTRGPFFPEPTTRTPTGHLRMECRLLGVIEDHRLVSSAGRPRPGSRVRIVEASDGIDFGRLRPVSGGVVLGELRSDQEVIVRVDEADKAVLPRNVGVFGTVGSGKSNTTQVLMEEAASAGWSVVVIDVEGEYTRMDRPNRTKSQQPGLTRIGRPAKGVEDLKVFLPAPAGKRRGTIPFIVPIAGYDLELLGALLDATDAQRRLLHAAVDRYGPEYDLEQLAWAIDQTSSEGFYASTRQILAERLRQLAAKGLFDDKRNVKVPYLSAEEMIQAGRISVIDVSQLDDRTRNLTLGHVLQTAFRIVQRFERGDEFGSVERPPVMIVMEEVQTFFGASDEAARVVMDFLQDVARRGRKRWLSMVMVSQQPAALPMRLFELLNTRLIHQTKSETNLNALRRSCGDVDAFWWRRVPDLAPGSCLLSGPAVQTAAEVMIRPASSERLLVE